MPKVVVSLPSLCIREKGWEPNKEVYVLSLATDLRGADPKRNDTPIAAHNETLPNAAPEVQKAAAMQYVVVEVSNTFEQVHPDQPVPLVGSGIILYPNLDPMGMLGLHFAVIESDAKTRNLGKLLSTILEADEVKRVMAAGLPDYLMSRPFALTPIVSQPMLARLLNTLIDSLPQVLMKNGDDLLLAHSLSGFDFDDYGLSPGTSQMDFPITNDRVSCTVRVRLNE